MNISLIKIFCFFFFLTILVSCSNGKIEYKFCDKGCVEFKTSYPVSDTIFHEPRTPDEELEKEIREHKLAEEMKLVDSIQRTSKEAFLVNSSSANIYTFTVKLIDDTPDLNISTITFKLYPGERRSIGCNKYVVDGRVINRIYKIVGEFKHR